MALFINQNCKPMKQFKFILLNFMICIAMISCNKKNNIKITGTIYKQGITTYQYGTHVINNYALRSNSIDLDLYIDSAITVVGDKIDGYPVEGGPDYIEVKKIK